jgi:site-specific DNA-methyltransferase (adenine-specific)
MATTSSRPGYMATATSSASDEWPTPQWLVDRLAAEFGPFDLDPASTRSSAKAPVFYTKDDDGLAQPWKGRVWCNPPYGYTIGRWTAKARDEVAAARADLVVMLVPVRTGSRWWTTSTASAALVRFIPGRLRNADGSQWPFDSAILVFGALTGRHGTRAQKCAHCRRVFWPARAGAKTCSDRCRKALSRSQISGLSVTIPRGVTKGPCMNARCLRQELP